MNERIEAWLRLRDVSRFKAGMKSAAASVRSFGKEMNWSGGVSRLASTAYGGAVGTLSALAVGAKYAGAALATGIGAGAVAGVKFNAQMETNEVAFANFLGSTQKARAYLDELYQIAAKTPFEFPELAGAARRFLAFGFSAKETKKILGTVGDTVAGIGGGGAEIDRLVMALGQIQAKGKLSTEELLQMAEMGIPAFQILKKEMGLTGSELEDKLRKGAIGADKAIAALTKGMDARFKGSSESQSKTFAGQWSTFKDIANQSLGELTEPLFNLLKDKVLPGLVAGLPKVMQTIRGSIAGVTAGLGFNKDGIEGGDKVQSTALKIGKVLKQAFSIGKVAIAGFLETIKPAAPFFNNILLPLFIGIAKGVIGSVVAAFKIALPIVKFFFQALGWVGRVAAPLKGVFEGIGLVIGVVFAGPILKGISLLGKLGGVFRVVAGIARVAAIPLLFMVKVYKMLFTGVFKLAMFLGKNLVSAIGGVGKLLGSVGSKLVNLGKDLVGKVVDGIKSAPGKILDALLSLVPGPIKGAVKKALGLFPGLATGGVITSSGWSVVGEEGPELRYMPSGSAIVPMKPAVASPLPSTASFGGGKEGKRVTKVYIGRRQIAEAVEDEGSDQGARR